MEVVSNVATGPASSGKNTGLRRLPRFSDDELRLFDDRKQQRDPGEVRIPTPGITRPANAAMKSGIPKGPQPRNTLSTSNRNRQPGKFRVPWAKDQTTNSNIAVVVSKGDNVPKSKSVHQGYSSFEGPPAKRQKTTATTQDQSSQTTGSDGIDELSLQQDFITSLTRESSRPSQVTSNLSPGNEYLRSYFGSQEYHNVEDTMDSRPHRKHRGKRRPDKSPAESFEGSCLSSHSGMEISSAANPINLSDDEKPHKPPTLPTQLPKYQGTANQDHKNSLPAKDALRNQPIQDTGTTSRHFMQAVKPQTAQRRPLADISTSHSVDEVDDSNDRLDGKFLATNGKPRSGDFASSPDVLNGATTVGISSRQTSPCKNSSSTRKGSPIKDQQASLPASNIPPTAFSAANGQGKHSESKRSRSSVKEAAASWGIRLAAVTRGDYVHRSTSLGLEYNPNLDSYDVIEGGTSLAIQDPSLRINLEKLHKVSWSLEDGRVRLESAKSNGIDNILDLELCSNREVLSLIAKLQESNHRFRVKGQEGDKLRKMFENRLSQQKLQKTAKIRKINPAVDEGQEIALLEKRKARRDANDGLQHVEETGQKRRRLGSRTVDQLKDNGVFELPWNRSSQTRGISDKPPRDSHHNKGKQEDVEDGWVDQQSSALGGIDNILDSLKMKPQNTYSTRSKTERAPNSLRTSLSNLDESGPVRYSKTHDMGKPWSKPLTYPKTGKKKATVEWGDLERLDEGEFFNDTLIEFYLRYLQHQLEIHSPNVAKKIYFFNTFFFKNLTHKGKGSRSSNYELVMNWTRGVDIFTYDYIVVPINESFHWYVAVICNLPALNRYPDSMNIDPTLRTGNQGRLSPSSARSRTPEEASSPAEQDARNSFAELSLEQRQGENTANTENGNGGAVPSAAEDQEMLDTQLNGDIAAAGMTMAEGGLKDIITTKEPALAESTSPQTSASKKKGKRKSLPSVKRLDPGQPAVVTFDSLTGTHPTTVRVIKDYLLAEADKKRGMIFDEKQIKGMTAVGIPKQDNFCDCGPFLLGYMAKFLENPHDFMGKTLQKSFDVDSDWPLFGPSKLRADLRELLLKLHREQDHERRESAKKSGKYVPRKPEPSPTQSAAQGVEQEKPSDTTSKVVDQISRSTSPTPATRKAALSTALPIDADEPSNEFKLESKSPKESAKAIALEKEQAVAIVDSQSQAHSRPTSPLPPAPAAELPSTIQDSQPAESFDELQADVPTNPTSPRYEGPPEPVSSPVDAKGVVDSPTWSTEVTRTLRSSPRSSRKRGRKTEVVELD